jgi:formyltetrahydrofolate hydrolase
MVLRALTPPATCTGRDVESRVLARAVKLDLERPVMPSGSQTVVFGK